MNKVILMGRLTRDPELRYSNKGEEQTAICNYTLAVDREAQGLERYIDPMHDALMQMIKMTVDAAHSKGIPVAVCGVLNDVFSALRNILDKAVAVNKNIALLLQNVHRPADTGLGIAHMLRNIHAAHLRIGFIQYIDRFQVHFTGFL